MKPELSEDLKKILASLPNSTAERIIFDSRCPQGFNMLDPFHMPPPAFIFGDADQAEGKADSG